MSNEITRRPGGAPWTLLGSIVAALALTVAPTAQAACTSSEDCNDGVYCNGYEVCDNGTCTDGVPPCNEDQSCDEEDDLCLGGGPNPGHALGEVSDVEPTFLGHESDALDSEFAPLSR
jgi:hypothetical protein